MLLGEQRDALRKAEVAEDRDVARDQAEGEGDRSALAEAVDAEPRQAGRGVGQVELARLLERGGPGRVVRSNGREYALELRVAKGRPVVEREQRAVAAERRRPRDLEVHVAGTRFDCAKGGS